MGKYVRLRHDSRTMKSCVGAHEQAGNKRVELQERLITCANVSRRLKNQNPHADKVAASSAYYQQKFLLAETRQQPEVPPFGLLFF